MKKFLIFLIFPLLFSFDAQREDAFQTGEWFKFRVHYGLINAGYATLEVQDGVINNKKVYHVIGKGYSTGMSRFFFKVDDLYESYFDKVTGNPYKYIRKIDEGGYTKNQEGFFNLASDRVLVKDFDNKTEKTYVIPNNTQDIVSAFYYLRNYPTINKLKVGESVAIDMFFDEETTKFKLKFIGREDLNTKFGVIPTMIFRPLVQSGRVFKEQEALTVWISDDDNKIPVRIQASLTVGSIKADLDGFKGLKNSFTIKVK
ncbi:MAG: DUF3108 domain-containing protein [Flavobacterium sp.]|nr:DUF3108 domain-containing protein [Flavobacterium sp.]